MSRLDRKVASFYRRRIAIPVGPDDLVLDVGSGDKPHWRADVLLDRYTGAAHAGQRSGGAAAKVSRPLFDADAAAMPFADGAFDYVVCSHVLEHVVDPAAVVAEICRVGKAGYVEVPEAASAKICDFPSHLWWCRLDRRDGTERLVLTAKEQAAFDPEIAAYLDRSGLRRPIAGLLDSEFDHRIVSLHWTGGLEITVEGEPSPELVDAALTADAQQRTGQHRIATALTWLLTLPRRYGPGRITRREPPTLDQILRPELRTGTGEALERRIYRR